MPTTSRWAILAIFVVSGAAGLVYEIVWSRQLVLVFGNTTQAVSAILAGFFGGMAIGSVVGGRLADRVRSPLRLYGLIELVLVVVVLVTPLTFGVIRSLYGEVAVGLEGAPQLLAVLRLGPCAAGPGAGDRADGRHAADADAPSQRRRAPERVVRAVVRGEHDRRDPGHVRGRAGPDRGARARGRPAGGCALFGVRRGHGPDPVPASGAPVGADAGSDPVGRRASPPAGPSAVGRRSP